MRRRDVVKMLCSAAFTAPLAGRARSAERVRRVGMLLGTTASGPEPVGAFAQRLRELGWIDGRNIQVDRRAVAGDIDRFRLAASQLVSLGPDVILVQSNPGLAALRQVTD